MSFKAGLEPLTLTLHTRKYVSYKWKCVSHKRECVNLFTDTVLDRFLIDTPVEYEYVRLFTYHKWTKLNIPLCTKLSDLCSKKKKKE